ncbi:hypothetical protein EV356DRAFT_506751 [Viridothelium virens]|uniref:Checkpoint protein RAD24-like helical bundle domain-containing protein n=1 Tax=Viridothelium virens TaxID=1048519 RepID=A0A6A6H0Y8_VIRVR|nr:hypothetical protein EV356DRAFT_506751 [Viridothelium virens]
MGRTRKGRTAIVVSSGEEELPPTVSTTQHPGTRSNAPPLIGSQKRKLPNRSRRAVSEAQHHPEVEARCDSAPNEAATETGGVTSPNGQTRSFVGPKETGKPQTGNKTLYSFFNAATQKQQSRLSSSPEKEDIQEAIEDDIENDKPRSRSTSCTPYEKAAVTKKRTRSALGQSSIVREVDSFPVASQKFLKTRDGKKAVSTSKPNNHTIQVDGRPWTDKYSPSNLDELAVHKKKVSDVTHWLKAVFTGLDRKRLLVLKGPAGSGKTTTVSLLAEFLQFKLHEWKNPSTSDFASDDYVSVLTHFEDYIGRTGQFGALELGSVDDEHAVLKKEGVSSSPPAQHSGREAILIEEFPNTYMRSTSALHAFRATIQQFLAINTPSVASVASLRSDHLENIKPLIMIISETQVSTSTSVAESFTAQRLLGSEILHHAGTSVFDFKPVAPTFLTKALELVVVKEARQSGRRRTPAPPLLKTLAETGDIRSAISTLEFLCVRGDEGEGWGSKIAFTKPKRAPKEQPLTNIEQESLKMISNRGGSLDLFHGLGKVLYNKRQDPSPTEPPVAQPPSYLPQHRRLKVPENDVDELLDEIGADVDTFVSALHENYALSCSGLTPEDTLDCIDACMESLSDADILTPNRLGSGNRTFQNIASDTLRQSEVSFHVSVRGLLFALPIPVKRVAPPPGISDGQTKKSGHQDAFKMFFPASVKLWRRREEIEDLSEFLVTRLQRGHDLQPTKTVSSNMFTRNAVSTPSASATPTKGDGDSTSQTRLGSGSPARIDGVLEYLPYMAILQRCRGTLLNLQGLEDVTRFRGVGLVTEDEQDDLDVAPREPHVPTGDEQKVEKLVLSDDDIED